MNALAAQPVPTPVKYYGSKSRLAPWILSMVPAHRVWVEGCCGSAVMTLAKQRSPYEILNDRSNDLVTFLQVLRDDPDGLARVCGLSPHSRTEWASARLDVEVSDLERARRVWVRLQQSFGQTLSTGTGWSWSTGRNQSPPATARAMVTRFAAVADRLMDATIECRPVVELLESMVPRLGPGDVVYLDPPYPKATRNTPGGAGYQIEMTDADHRDLADVSWRLDALVLISSYPSALYDDLFAGWWSYRRGTFTTMSNASAVSRAARTEVLWSNRPLEVQTKAAQLELPAS